MFKEKMEIVDLEPISGKSGGYSFTLVLVDKVHSEQNFMQPLAEENSNGAHEFLDTTLLQALETRDKKGRFTKSTIKGNTDGTHDNE
jgi:hypothetical protein